MDSDLRKSMFAYYEARAPEYDEIYDLGGSAASISAALARAGPSEWSADRPIGDTWRPV